MLFQVSQLRPSDPLGDPRQMVEDVWASLVDFQRESDQMPVGRAVMEMHVFHPFPSFVVHDNHVFELR
jgi:hypothetical protein